MRFNEFLVKDSENTAVLSEPGYIKALKIRKAIGSFIGSFIVILIIGGFGAYGFLKGLLFLVGGLILWWIINIILNIIFTPIFNALIKSYVDKNQ